MISITPKKSLHMIDIICTKAILHGQETIR